MSLQVSGLCAGYSGSKVLQEVTLAVEAGEIVALLGRNGMGKSTLARTLVGSHQRDSGEIRLDGTAIERSSAARRFALGLRSMRQEKPVLVGLNVRENLSLAGVEVDRAAESFPFIAERVHQDAGTLSGGEQKMLALARLSGNPGSVWVLDEPTEGLQPANVDRSGVLISAAAAAGTGVLLIEQHLSLAVRIAHRWMVLEKGVIVAAGEVAEGSEAEISAMLTF